MSRKLANEILTALGVDTKNVVRAVINLSVTERVHITLETVVIEKSTEFSNITRMIKDFDLVERK